MRIKFAGPITPERLATALEAVAATYGESFGGIYGANLYVTVYDKHGERLELVNHRGKEIVLNFGVPDGEMLRPALSEAGKEKKLARQKVEDEEREIEMQRRGAHLEETMRQQKATMEKTAELREIVRRYNEISAALLQAASEQFITRMNDVIREVWEETKPLYPSGQNKGKPRMMPWYEHANGVLVLHRAANGMQPMKLKNPIYKVVHDRLDTSWNHPAWLNVVGRIPDVMFALGHEQIPGLFAAGAKDQAEE